MRDIEDIRRLHREGEAIWKQFDLDVRKENFHPFVPAAYETVLTELLALRQPGLRFLEWGSATGIITIMADMLGYDAYGIELDADLVRVARELASRFGSQAKFATGSFIPAGYTWRSATGDPRQGTIGTGVPGYAELGAELETFDYVFAYPWTGEEPMMQDIIRRRGGTGTVLLQYGPGGVQRFDPRDSA